MIQPKENRSGDGTGATSRSTSHSTTSDAHDSTVAPRIPHLTAAERAAAVPAYVLLAKSQNDRLSRRLFLSLPAAIRATERAQQRGSAVHLELFHAVPVTVDVDHGIGDAR